MAAELPRLTHNNNLTTSQLVFAPKKEDQGRVLTCEAENEVFPKVNKSSELNVYFIPVLNLELEDTQIDPSYIVFRKCARSCVYFCEVLENAST